MIKSWVQPAGKYPKYFHTSVSCLAILREPGDLGEVYQDERAPAGVALCPDCELEMGSA